MNQPLSVYELIANASLLVQGVMALLVLASVVSWMMILQRWSLLRFVPRRSMPAVLPGITIIHALDWRASPPYPG